MTTLLFLPPLFLRRRLGLLIQFFEPVGDGQRLVGPALLADAVGPDAVGQMRQVEFCVVRSSCPLQQARRCANTAPAAAQINHHVPVASKRRRTFDAVREKTVRRTARPLNTSSAAGSLLALGTLSRFFRSTCVAVRSRKSNHAKAAGMGHQVSGNPCRWLR